MAQIRLQVGLEGPSPRDGVVDAMMTCHVFYVSKRPSHQAVNPVRPEFDLEIGIIGEVRCNIYLHSFLISFGDRPVASC